MIEQRKKRKGNGTLLLMVALIVVIAVVLIMWKPEEAIERAMGKAKATTEQQVDEVDEVEQTTLVKVGDVAPDFEVTMVDGSTVKLSSLRGKVVLLNFWATWCPPCREEFTRVDKDIIERYKGKEFVLLPISRGEKKGDVEAFREKSGYTFPMGLDLDESIFNKYASNYIPRNFLIDKEGRVVLASVGYTEEEFDAMLTKIDNELKK